MTNFDQFHDGFFDGILIQDTEVFIQLRTYQNERFEAVLRGTVALAANGLRVANVVFEVLTRNAAEMTLQDISELYDLTEGPTGENQRQLLLKQAQERALLFFEIVPSYGGGCVALAKSVEIINRS